MAFIPATHVGLANSLGIQAVMARYVSQGDNHLPLIRNCLTSDIARRHFGCVQPTGRG